MCSNMALPYTGCKSSLVCSVISDYGCFYPDILDRVVICRLRHAESFAQCSKHLLYFVMLFVFNLVVQ